MTNVDRIVHDLLMYQLHKNPWPWKITQDWAFDVMASNGAIIALCRTHEEAKAILEVAESIYKIRVGLEIGDQKIPQKPKKGTLKMSDQERLCEDCGKKIRKDKQGIICDKCAQENIAFYANPPREIIKANQRRIYGKVLSDKEFKDHIQQKNDED